MSKRNIEVKEKALIEKMNNHLNEVDETKKPYEAPETTYVWDNNGPVQFEGNDAWKNDYFKDKEVKPLEVSLTPRNEDGTIMKGYDDFIDDPQDREDSRVSKGSGALPLGKVIDLEVEKLMNNKEVHLLALNKALSQIKDTDNEDTQMRTHQDKEKEYEYVNHPKHYNNYDVEVIDMMERVFGLDETYAFCKLNAFKYRMRAGTKPNISTQQDLDKEQWYLNRAANIKDRLTNLSKAKAVDKAIEDAGFKKLQ